MAVGDRQHLIAEIVAEVLGQPAEVRNFFPWLINQHTKEDFGSLFPTICQIYSKLGGQELAGNEKRKMRLPCDAFFGKELNFIFEFDEFQHFSSARLKTLTILYGKAALGFSKSEYEVLCEQHSDQADSFRRKTLTKDFNFIGGRTAQRAYFDSFRDLLPQLHGLRPTIRVSEFEVESVHSNNIESRSLLKRLLERKLEHAI